MKFILGAPGTGKTKELLRMSAENKVPVLCESVQRKERLLDRALQYGYIIPVPIVFNEMQDDDRVVYVDDIDRLLTAIFHCKVDTVTLNLEHPEDVRTLK